MTFIDLLIVLSFRYFVFDFYLFRSIRDYLTTTGWFFKKLLKCSFCQGFWTGCVYYLLAYHISFYCVLFGFASAILSYTWVVLTFKLSQEMETMK